MDTAQLIMVNVFKQLGRGAFIIDLITSKMIHTMGALFVDDMDLYTWREGITDKIELWHHTQLDLATWSCLLNATGGTLKPEKCFWYTLDYVCTDGDWTHADMVPHTLVITNPDGSKSPIKQEEVDMSKKTLGVHDSLSGKIAGHLDFIKDKATTWINHMMNGHLPHHMAWVAYKHQLWPGLRYGLGTMTNDVEAADNLLDKEDYRMLNILGVVRTVYHGLRKLHTTFGDFGLSNLAAEQLISRINTLFQHYHTPSNISKKLDMSLRYLQLQIGTPHNPLTLDYKKQGFLALLLWVKMLWRLLQHFDITLHMNFPSVPHQCKQDQVLMDIIQECDLAQAKVKSLNRCRGKLEAIFLSDITTADGQYLEHSALCFKAGVSRKS